MRTRRVLGLVCGLAGMFAAEAKGQDAPVAFVQAHVIPVSGPEIDRGTLVVQHGKIVAVGAQVAIPAGAEIVDASGKTLMPGLVDTHSHIGGLAGADGSAPIQPEIRVFDSLSPFESGFRRALAGGITTVNVMPGSGHLLSGQTVYLKIRAKAGEATTIDRLFQWPEGDTDHAGVPLGGIKMANGTNMQGPPPFPGTRAKSAALVRERFIKAVEYREKIKRAAGDAAKMPERDLGLEALVEVLDGTRVVHHHTHRADDIMTVLRLQREFGFRLVLHHVSEAWKVADEIAKAKVPCSVIVVDSPGGKLEAAEMSWKTAAALNQAGAMVAFHTDDWITDSRLFLRSAGLGVRAGLPREAALAAVTINGAKMLDLDARVGSLEAGKDADFLVLSGDPLSVYTKIEQTWVEGRKVFDRSDPKDHLWAVGGYGAGESQRPYMCCVDGAGVGGGQEAGQ